MPFDIDRNVDQRSQINLLIFCILKGLIDGTFSIGGGGGGGGDASAANQVIQINLETLANNYLADIDAALTGNSVTFASAPDIDNITAGTRVQGSAVVTPRGVIITAKQGNQEPVYVGDATVTNAAGGNQGLILPASKSSPILLVANLNQIYIDADNSGDGVGVLIL